jgi:flagella basal body P-ring formation protein FlgA
MFKITSLLLGSLIFITSQVHANTACKVVSFPKIIKLNKVLDESIIKESNCSQEIKNNFVDFISGASGDLDSRHLTQIFKMEYKTEIELSPEKVSVQPINDVIIDLIKIPRNLTLDKTSSLYGQSSLNLSPSDHLQATCNNCETAGSKNIKLLVNKSPIWFSVEILSKRHGLVINSEINPFAQRLTSAMFTHTAIFDDGRDHLFNDIKNIHFYKANKKLVKGKILKSTDLSPITLVRLGQKIKVVLKGQNIALKSSAIARQQGKFGDYIEVYNQKTNRKINAQVIDFNTVMVEL